jgi:hypothetical protein
MTNRNIYEHEAQKIASIVIEKRQAYGKKSLEQVEAIISILYPTGITSQDYPKVLTIIRLLDKITRLTTANKEDKEDAWTDIAGYALRTIVRNKEIKPGSIVKLDGRNE